MNLTENFTDETFMEMLVFTGLFEKYSNDIDSLEYKFNWYFEQYCQMLEMDKENNFFKHLLNTREMQLDIKKSMAEI